MKVQRRCALSQKPAVLQETEESLSEMTSMDGTALNGIKAGGSSAAFILPVCFLLRSCFLLGLRRATPSLAPALCTGGSKT